jgi:hypothetical protein
MAISALGGYRDISPITQADIDEASQVFHSDLLNQDFTNALVMAKAEREELMRRATPSKEEIELEAMNRDEWEPLLRGRAMQEWADQNKQQREDAGHIFVRAHPEMRDNQANANKIRKAIEVAGRQYDTNVADLEKVYQKLVAQGEIELNEKVIAKQMRDRQIAEATKHLRTVNFNEAEAYELPMDELRRRAGGQSRW